MALRFPKSMAEFEERFSTESACRDYFFSVRWPEGWRCPRCASEGGWRNGRGLVECRRCGHQSSLTAGTVFHGTKTPLRLWFKAIFLMVAQKNGVSAKALQHLLGVSYPTAWTWLQKLRSALSTRPHAPLSGLVEVDDAYWGGYRKGEPGRRKGGGSKDLLVVAVEDKGRVMGRVRLSRAPDHTAKSFSKVVKCHVARGSLVRTDGLSSYRQLPAKGYVHLPAVIGENDSFLSQAIVPRLLNGTFYFSGRGDKRISLLNVKNFPAIVEAVLCRGPLGDVFNCTDSAITWRELIDAYARVLNVDPGARTKSFLSVLPRYGDKSWALIMCFSRFGAHYPNDKLSRRLGGLPIRFSWQEAVKEAASGFLEQV